MVSVYGYITLAQLEKDTGTDWSAIHTTIFIDANVEAQITKAERAVNVWCHQSFTGTIPDAVILVTTELADRMLFNLKLLKGFGRVGDSYKNVSIKLDGELKALLTEYIKTDLEEDSIDIIPMSRNQYYR